MQQTDRIVRADESATTLWLDFIRFLAILWVITIHCSGILLYLPISPHWWVGNFYDSLARPAVPLFIMLSGALLLSNNKIESIAEFYKKRVVKLVVPLIIWSFIYLSLTAYESHQPLNIIVALKQIAEAPVMYHLGFMYIILGLYLVAPIFQIYANAAMENNLFYFIGLWFVINSVLMVFAKFFNFGFGIQFVGINGFVGYYIGGYLIKNFEIMGGQFKQKLILMVLFIMSLAITMGGTYILNNHGGTLDEFFYEYLSPNIVFMTFALFLLIKQTEPFLRKITTRYLFLEKVLIKFRTVTFGIYFVHVLVLVALSGHLGLHLTALSFNPVASVPFLVILVTLISLFIVMIIQKIPLVRWMAP